MSQVTGVNAASGDLILADSVIRPFAAPSIAKVTSLAAHDIAINSVIVQGAVPLAVTETFNFSASNDQFLSDTSIGGGNLFELELNTVEHFAFTGNTITAINGGYIRQELCQRDSQNGAWTGNTFQDTAVGFGEYAANITNGSNCLMLVGHGTVVSGNTITATGSATGVYVADTFANVTNNTIQIGRGTGMLLYTPPYIAATVAGNTLSGTGGRIGIYVGSLPAPNTGGYNIYGNSITGFATPMSIDPH